MADTTKNLPEGTDTVVTGAGASGSSGGTGIDRRSDTTNPTGGSSGSNAGSRSAVTSAASGSTDRTDDLITEDSGNSDRQGIRGMLSTGAGKVRDEAGTRARGFVGQGLERGSATLTNISGIVSQTAGQLDEQLGSQYGDYARQAGQALERYATTLANKDPDELVDDARDLVRKSPGVAIAGAALIGFGLVRLLKAGLPEDGKNGNRTSDRSGGAR